MNLYQTDPEFMERWEQFALEEVINEEGQQLPDQIRYMAILAALIGCQGVEVFHQILPQALDVGLSPVMIKEVVYQAVDYLGYGRMFPFLTAVNEVLQEKVCRFRFLVKPQQPLKIVWKKGLRRRQIFLEII